MKAQNKTSMAEYESMLKFLDVAVRATKAHTLATHNLEKKLIYSAEITKLKDARIKLRALYYVYEDYAKTGHYEVPEIKPLNKCVLCGKTK